MAWNIAGTALRGRPRTLTMGADMAAEVTINSGRLAGGDDQGVHAYKGIPYAAPPVGDLRFQPPAAPANWDGVRQASDYGPVALQQPMPGIFGELGTPPNPAGDDCLRLNVWTPDPGAGGMPVLVWIHGGAFYAGSGVDDVYNGAAFARDGVVCVTINYRLGVQGFMNLAGHFPALAQSGNLGMLDQIAALRWVQDNIGAFGGDPSKVTIAGESAGGMSCSTLMAMPSANGLFRAAIPQSGAAHNGLSADTASLISTYVMEAVGVTPGDSAALAAVSNDDLLAAQIAITDDLGATRDPEKYREAAAVPMAFQPTYFTEELPQRPIDAIAGGSAKDVSVMVGSTKEEALIFVVDLKEIFNEELVQATVGAVFGMAGKDGGRRVAGVHRQPARGCAARTRRSDQRPTGCSPLPAHPSGRCSIGAERGSVDVPVRLGEPRARGRVGCAPLHRGAVRVRPGRQRDGSRFRRRQPAGGPDCGHARRLGPVRYRRQPQPRRPARLATLGCEQPAHDALRQRVPRLQQPRRRRDQPLGTASCSDSGGGGCLDRGGDLGRQVEVVEVLEPLDGLRVALALCGLPLGGTLGELGHHLGGRTAPLTHRCPMETPAHAIGSPHVSTRR